MPSMLNQIAEEAVSYGVSPIPMWPEGLWLEFPDMAIEVTCYPDSEAVSVKATFPTGLSYIEQPESTPCRLSCGINETGGKELVVEFFADTIIGYQPGLLGFVHHEFRTLATDYGINLHSWVTPENYRHSRLDHDHLTTFLPTSMDRPPVEFSVEAHRNWVRITCRYYDEFLYERKRVGSVKQECERLNRRYAPGLTLVEWDCAVTAHWDFYYADATDVQLRLWCERAAARALRLVEEARALIR